MNDQHDINTFYGADKKPDDHEYAKSTMKEAKSDPSSLAKEAIKGPADLVPAPLDPQYENERQLRSPLISENQKDEHDAKHFYSPDKIPNQMQHSQADQGDIGPYVLAKGYKEEDVPQVASLSESKINPKQPDGIVWSPKDRQCQVAEQREPPLIFKNQKDKHGIQRYYNPAQIPNQMEHGQTSPATSDTTNDIKPTIAASQAQVNPIHPTGPAPSPKNMQYEVPKQLKQPLLLPNQKTGNEDDFKHRDNPGQYANTHVLLQLKEEPAKQGSKPEEPKKEEQKKDTEKARDVKEPTPVFIERCESVQPYELTSVAAVSVPPKAKSNVAEAYQSDQPYGLAPLPEPKEEKPAEEAKSQENTAARAEENGETPKEEANIILAQIKGKEEPKRSEEKKEEPKSLNFSNSNFQKSISSNHFQQQMQIQNSGANQTYGHNEINSSPNSQNQSSLIYNIAQQNNNLKNNDTFEIEQPKQLESQNEIDYLASPMSKNMKAKLEKASCSNDSQIKKQSDVMAQPREISTVAPIVIQGSNDNEEGPEDPHPTLTLNQSQRKLQSQGTTMYDHNLKTPPSQLKVFHQLIDANAKQGLNKHSVTTNKNLSAAQSQEYKPQANFDQQNAREINNNLSKTIQITNDKSNTKNLIDGTAAIAHNENAQNDNSIGQAVMQNNFVKEPSDRKIQKFRDANKDFHRQFDPASICTLSPIQRQSQENNQQDYENVKHIPSQSEAVQSMQGHTSILSETLPNQIDNQNDHLFTEALPEAAPIAAEKPNLAGKYQATANSSQYQQKCNIDNQNEPLLNNQQLIGAKANNQIISGSKWSQIDQRRSYHGKIPISLKTKQIQLQNASQIENENNQHQNNYNLQNARKINEDMSQQPKMSVDANSDMLPKLQSIQSLPNIQSSSPIRSSCNQNNLERTNVYKRQGNHSLLENKQNEKKAVQQVALEQTDNAVPTATNGSLIKQSGVQVEIQSVLKKLPAAIRGSEGPHVPEDLQEAKMSSKYQQAPIGSSQTTTTQQNITSASEAAIEAGNNDEQMITPLEKNQVCDSSSSDINKAPTPQNDKIQHKNKRRIMQYQHNNSEQQEAQPQFEEVNYTRGRNQVSKAVSNQYRRSNRNNHSNKQNDTLNKEKLTSQHQLGVDKQQELKQMNETAICETIQKTNDHIIEESKLYPNHLAQTERNQKQFASEYKDTEIKQICYNSDQLNKHILASQNDKKKSNYLGTGRTRGQRVREYLESDNQQTKPQIQQFNLQTVQSESDDLSELIRFNLHDDTHDNSQKTTQRTLKKAMMNENGMIQEDEQNIYQSPQTIKETYQSQAQQHIHQSKGLQETDNQQLRHEISTDSIEFYSNVDLQGLSKQSSSTIAPHAAKTYDCGALPLASPGPTVTTEPQMKSSDQKTDIFEAELMHPASTRQLNFRSQQMQTGTTNQNRPEQHQENSYHEKEQSQQSSNEALKTENEKKEYFYSPQVRDEKIEQHSSVIINQDAQSPIKEFQFQRGVSEEQIVPNGRQAQFLNENRSVEGQIPLQTSNAANSYDQELLQATEDTQVRLAYRELDRINASDDCNQIQQQENMPENNIAIYSSEVDNITPKQQEDNHTIDAQSNLNLNAPGSSIAAVSSYLPSSSVPIFVQKQIEEAKEFQHGHQESSQPTSCRNKEVIIQPQIIKKEEMNGNGKSQPQIIDSQNITAKQYDKVASIEGQHENNLIISNRSKRQDVNERQIQNITSPLLQICNQVHHLELSPQVISGKSNAQAYPKTRSREISRTVFQHSIYPEQIQKSTLPLSIQNQQRAQGSINWIDFQQSVGVPPVPQLKLPVQRQKEELNTAIAISQISKHSKSTQSNKSNQAEANQEQASPLLTNLTNLHEISQDKDQIRKNMKDFIRKNEDTMISGMASIRISCQETRRVSGGALQYTQQPNLTTQNDSQYRSTQNFINTGRSRSSSADKNDGDDREHYVPILPMGDDENNEFQIEHHQFDGSSINQEQLQDEELAQKEQNHLLLYQQDFKNEVFNDSASKGRSKESRNSLEDYANFASNDEDMYPQLAGQDQHSESFAQEITRYQSQHHRIETFQQQNDYYSNNQQSEHQNLQNQNHFIEFGFLPKVNQVNDALQFSGESYSQQISRNVTRRNSELISRRNTNRAQITDDECSNDIENQQNYHILNNQEQQQNGQLKNYQQNLIIPNISIDQSNDISSLLDGSTTLLDQLDTIGDNIKNQMPSMAAESCTTNQYWMPPQQLTSNPNEEVQNMSLLDHQLELNNVNTQTLQAELSRMRGTSSNSSNLSQSQIQYFISNGVLSSSLVSGPGMSENLNFNTNLNTQQMMLLNARGGQDQEDNSHFGVPPTHFNGNSQNVSNQAQNQLIQQMQLQDQIIGNNQNLVNQENHQIEQGHDQFSLNRLKMSQKFMESQNEKSRQCSVQTAGFLNNLHEDDQTTKNSYPGYGQQIALSQQSDQNQNYGLALPVQQRDRENEHIWKMAKMYNQRYFPYQKSNEDLKMRLNQCPPFQQQNQPSLVSRSNNQIEPHQQFRELQQEQSSGRYWQEQSLQQQFGQRHTIIHDQSIQKFQNPIGLQENQGDDNQKVAELADIILTNHWNKSRPFQQAMAELYRSESYKFKEEHWWRAWALIESAQAPENSHIEHRNYEQRNYNRQNDERTAQPQEQVSNAQSTANILNNFVAQGQAQRTIYTDRQESQQQAQTESTQRDMYQYAHNKAQKNEPEWEAQMPTARYGPMDMRYEPENINHHDQQQMINNQRQEYLRRQEQQQSNNNNNLLVYQYHNEQLHQQHSIRQPNKKSKQPKKLMPIVYLQSNLNKYCNKNERSQIYRILPLLRGGIFYKRFSNWQSLKLNENAFDPLKADQCPPEQCGYGMRFLQLDQELQFLNIRLSLKNTIEQQIPLSEIVKPILPAITMDIIKVKKESGKSGAASPLWVSGRDGRGRSQSNEKYGSQIEDKFVIFDNNKSTANISHLAKIGLLDKNSDLYRQKCIDSTFFPFSIALGLNKDQNSTSKQRISQTSLKISGSQKAQKGISQAKPTVDLANHASPGSNPATQRAGGRIELVATSHKVLKEWIIGINFLINNKKDLRKIMQNIQYIYEKSNPY